MILIVVGRVSAASSSDDRVRFEPTLYTQVTLEGDAPKGEQYDVRYIRFGATMFTNGPLSAKIELEQVDATDKHANWLRQAFLVYKKNDDNLFRFGRLPILGSYNVPSPSTLKTVNFAHNPFDLYGWGMEHRGKSSKKLSTEISLTGGTGVAFSSGENLEKLVISGRINYALGNLTLSPGFQTGKGMQRLGLDFVAQPSPQTEVRGLVYHAREDGRNQETGGYIFMGWKPAQFFELHAQVDRPSSDAIVATVGYGINWGKHVTVTFDRVREFKDGGHGQYWGKLQFKF